MNSKKFKVNDRVKRAKGDGCFGTVSDVRQETTTPTTDNRDKTLMIRVLWDNGTQSFFGPDGLEAVKE